MRRLLFCILFSFSCSLSVGLHAQVLQDSLISGEFDQLVDEPLCLLPQLAEDLAHDLVEQLLCLVDLSCD